MNKTSKILVSLVIVMFLGVATSNAQDPWTPEKPGSDNISIEGHLPLGGLETVADIEIEQEIERPYVYVARSQYRDPNPVGTDIIDISDPGNPRLIARWRIEDPDLHVGSGALDVKYFKWAGRYYVVQSVQFSQGGPNADMGAVVLDVTDLPDGDSVHEVARIYAPETPGGFHNIFIYKHSNGRVLLFSTVRGSTANVYDLGMVVEGDVGSSLVAQVPTPSDQTRRAYHDFYVGFHMETGTDRFYGGGTGGYYIYDLTDLDNPELLVSLTGISGVRNGHTFTPTPDGRYVVAETEYQYAPLRIFDLKPALDGEVSNISQPIGAWASNWQHLPHNHEVRWPYVFVSSYLDGLQIFSMLDPTNPVTVGYYDTFTAHPEGGDEYGVMLGAFGVDVRNADGLIVISDLNTGFWSFRMEGFNGWNGEDWGVPDISSEQKWDEESREGTR
ncbi:MAG: hypothetical protein O6942_08555 [Bacteroidetes bacterium]|nr:hypothetical protein [Bacteroidota bacterium]